MKLYKIYGKELFTAEVEKETKCFYFINNSLPAFGYSSRIEKEDAILTPQEAIQAALNNKRTMQGAFRDRLAEIETELKCLEGLLAGLNEGRCIEYGETEGRHLPGCKMPKID